MELADLQSLGEQAREKYLSEYRFSEFEPSAEFLALFKSKYEEKHLDAQFIPGKHVAAIVTSTNNTIDFPYSLFQRVSYFLDFAKAYKEYKNLINTILHDNLSSLTKGYGKSELQLRTGLFEILKLTCPELSDESKNIVSAWKESLSSKDYVYTYFLKPLYQKLKNRNENEINNMFRFLSDNDWSYTGKSPIRLDGIGSAIMGLMSVVQVKQGVIPDLVDIMISHDSLLDLAQKDAKIFTPLEISTSAAGTRGKGNNVIYYGAPGTGKSYSIDRIVAGQDEFTIRTVFHTDTQNSDFIGCIKPVMDEDVITYQFRSGPFTDAVIKALKDSKHHYWLVIEEINRAPAAAVFGEVFQLLDRDKNGESKYKIYVSDPDMLIYINSELEGSDIGNLEKLYIPGNLSIMATMNSSDQAVMPMDTAFKRRWQFKYVPLDFDYECAKGTLPIPSGNVGVIEVEWKEFATAVNSILSDNGIPEDRHLGPFFLDNEELSVDRVERSEILTGKLFMYLWDDVLRHVNRETIFNPEIKTYGQLNKMFNNNENVFSDGFRSLINKTYPIPAEEDHDYLAVAEPSDE